MGSLFHKKYVFYLSVHTPIDLIPLNLQYFPHPVLYSFYSLLVMSQTWLPQCNKRLLAKEGKYDKECIIINFLIKPNLRQYYESWVDRVVPVKGLLKIPNDIPLIIYVSLHTITGGQTFLVFFRTCISIMLPSVAILNKYKLQKEKMWHYILNLIQR